MYRNMEGLREERETKGERVTKGESDWKREKEREGERKEGREKGRKGGREIQDTCTRISHEKSVCSLLTTPQNIPTIVLISCKCSSLHGNNLWESKEIDIEQ